MLIQPKNRIIPFILVWFLISGTLFAAFYFSGLAPDYFNEFASGVFAAVSGSEQVEQAVFSKDSAVVIIPKIGLTTPIVFPESKDMDVLKKALNLGVAHYPDSALPGENGNVFIFGHSSNKPFEKNPARTAFTKLSQLENGDEVFIQSGKIKYVYRVFLREIVDPEETRVYLNSDKPKLTLSTCWPVGDPKNRIVVEAEFMGKSF